MATGKGGADEFGQLEKPLFKAVPSKCDADSPESCLKPIPHA